MFNDLDLFTDQDEEIRLISRDLLEQGCCARCTMRFLGEKRPSVYSPSQEELFSKYFEQDTDTATNTQESAKKPCPACLGILQKFASQDFYEQVVEKVREGDHDYSDYQFSLMVPVATILRQHAVFVYLLQKYESVYQGKGDNIASIKDVFKWCAGPCFSQALGAKFQMRSAFDILLTISYSPSDQECAFLLEAFPDTFRRRKVKQGAYETFTRASVQKVLGEMTESNFSRKFSCPPSAPKEECTCDISVSHDAVFVAGRYQKYSRELSQSPWIIDGVVKMAGSVQELVCQVILDRFKPSDHKFSSSGREDVDVQMLGMGRPFVVELIDPHRVTFSPEDMKAMQKETNALTELVAIRDLQIVTREDVGRLKEGEEDKSKSYVALCWCERPLTEEDMQKISEMKDLVLYQRTPIRVLHRRTLATRERTIYSMRMEPASGQHFTLHLSTQAGTYVKEFVHGDFGRTQPNLGTLLNADCDILALDVTAVNIDWPPRIDPVPQDTLDAESETGKKTDVVSTDKTAAADPADESLQQQQNNHDVSTTVKVEV
ncbi:tRNA pseudouridine synthase Pus10-like [Littorina saxatilis]|uniref:tRNA pseudouridine(55) synthase n=1 Tax=Littorina saxatilis TaxID=31220 RepID=A0AAN9BCS1_9CAEN